MKKAIYSLDQQNKGFDKMLRLFVQIQIGNTSPDYGYEVNKQERYKGPGTAAELLYKASGGSIDWVKNVLKTPLVYTYELRGNSFHWPPSKISEQGEEVTQMILGLTVEARKLGYY